MSNEYAQAESFKRLGSHELLTQSQEQELGRRIQRGDEKARAELIEKNMRLVIGTARGFLNRGVEFDDLVQAGTIGLITAVDKFDPGRGFKFSTMATSWVFQSLQRCVAAQQSTIRLPDQVRKIRRTVATNPDMPLEEVARRHERSVAALLNALGAAEVTASLDVPVRDTEGVTRYEMIEDLHADDPSDVTDTAWVRGLLVSVELTDEERLVIELAFGLDPEGEQSDDSIAEIMGLTPGAVFTHKRNAMKKLREAI